MCGKHTLFKCEICDKWLCVLNDRKWDGAQCAIHYHDDSFFGLSRSDHKDLYGAGKSDWVVPTQSKMRSNKNRVAAIKRKIEEEEEGEH